jgi:hypothetical protein
MSTHPISASRSAGSGGSLPLIEPANLRRVVAVWLSFAIPGWWLARSVLEAAPAFLLAAFSPYTLAVVFYRLDGITARVFAPGAVTEDYRPGMSEAIQDPYGISLVLAISLAIALLGARARWRHAAVPASLLTSFLATALLLPWPRAFGGRTADPAWLAWLSILVGAGIAWRAFRALGEDTGIASRIGRMVTAAPLLALPPLFFLVMGSRGFPSGRSLTWFLILLPFLGLTALGKPRAVIFSRKALFVTISAGLAASLALLLLGPSSRSTPRTRERAQTPKPPPALDNSPYPLRFFQRGVSFTSEFPEPYDSPQSHEMLAKLRARSVDAIALVPYGVSAAGSTRLHYGGWERDESVLALSRTAHSLGMHVMLKPQVWVRGGYPGDFDLPDEGSRKKWLADYEKFALHYAELARQAHADLFCIGTEFVRLSPNEAFWRQLIAKIRKVYPGPLTYAANFGDEFETLAFWDALDYIGLNNYYPLPDSLDCQETVAKVEAVQRRFGKPVLFTEGGYSSSQGGHRKPWSEKEGPTDPAMQAKAYESVLAAFWEKPWFYGAYWWKVGSNAFGGPLDRSHTPWGKPAMDVISHWYRKKDRAGSD